MQKKKSSKLTPTTHVDGIADATVVDVNKIGATILDSNKPSVSRAGGAVSAAAVASTTAATAATTDAVTDATTSAVDAVDSAVAGAANTLVDAVDVAAGSAVTSVGDSSGGGSVSSSATGKKKMTSKGDGGSGVYSGMGPVWYSSFLSSSPFAKFGSISPHRFCQRLLPYCQLYPLPPLISSTPSSVISLFLRHPWALSLLQFLLKPPPTQTNPAPMLTYLSKTSKEAFRRQSTLLRPSAPRRASLRSCWGELVLLCMGVIPRVQCQGVRRAKQREDDPRNCWSILSVH